MNNWKKVASLMLAGMLVSQRFAVDGLVQVKAEDVTMNVSSISSLLIANAMKVNTFEVSFADKEIADVFINDEASFFRFAKAVAEGESYEGKIVKLTKDLDLSAFESFNGVGGSDKTQSFNGIFDGGGHTIYGAHVVSDGGKYNGLFNYVDNGTIKNLSVIKTTIEGTLDKSGCAVGGIVGTAYDTIIMNCNFQGNVAGYCAVGGIVGDVACDSVITNCGVAESKISGQYDIGGVAGYVYENVLLENSFFSGTLIEADSNVGGLTGVALGHLKNCYAIPTFQLPSDAECFGALVGKAKLGSASACYYAEDDNVIPVADTVLSTFKTIGCTREELKEEAFIKKLNANKVSYSADTWTNWVAGENGYPRLGNTHQVYITKVSGVSVADYNMYGVEGQTYSVTLKKGSTISKIIPSVYTIDGIKLDSTYEDNVFSFVMPNEQVYMNFETEQAVSTPTPTTNVTAKKAKLSFTQKVSTLKVGKKATFKVKKVAVTGTVKWSVSNKKRASISNKGVLKGKKAGKVKVTATCGKVKVTTSVTIKK